MHGPIGESNATRMVNSLVNQIQSRTPVQDSLFEQASVYFLNAEQDKQKLAKLTLHLEDAKQDYARAPKVAKSSLKEELKLAQRKHSLELSRQQDLRIKRREQVIKLCTLLIKTAEGNDWDETQTASAKVLGTLFLQSPRSGKKLAEQHQKLKPAYKAVLALRLLDKLLLDNNVTLSYIAQRYTDDERYSKTPNSLNLFQQEVCVPIVMAAIFQDIGLQHPEAQQVLKGQDEQKDEFRLLEQETRMRLLKLNHKHTMDYIEYGLGTGEYIGNSKEERDIYNENEQAKLAFIKGLMIDALKPKREVGNIIKIPQIYSSIIFSTKPNASYKDMPKAAMVIDKAAEHGSVNKAIAAQFINMVGHFPQGFGMTYIPKDNDGAWLDRYEYAIVTGLNPPKPYLPVCRTATRNLKFTSAGQVFTLDKNSNLHFSAVRKKLANISPERLKDILEKLCSNFEERKHLDLIPDSWHAYDYFSYTKMQNLWKKG